MPSAREDAPADADKAGKPAFLPHPLRIRGRTFHRSVGIWPQPPAADETSSGHGAIPSRKACGMVRQEAFVCVAAAAEAVVGASDLV